MLSSGKKKYDLSTLAFDYASKNIPEKISTEDIGRVGKVLVEIVQGIKERMHKTLRSEYVQKWMDKLGEKFAVTGLNGYELVHNYVDVPLAKSLAKMEKRGVLLDMEKLKALSDEITGEVEKTQKTIFEEIGHEFNLNSPKQLSDVLFTELSLPSNYQKSTREDILQTLVGMHPSIELILSYRELTKILNTYLTPFLQTEKKDEESVRFLYQERVLK
jgi:DNA polymerase I-like protein with 3'-5' exonuclease and polymerase domains